MKIYAISNRKIDRTEGGKDFRKLFHDSKFNPGDRGPMEINAVSITDDKGVHFGEVKDLFVEIQSRMKNEKKNALLFVHGFGNSWEDSYNRMKDMAELFDIIPILFTWPSAMDGNPFRDYREKKRYAMASSRALDRLMEKINECFEKTEIECGQSLSLAMHSMGNYLFKGMFTQGHYASETRIFDNIVMLAADVNNKNHKDFVDNIKCRGNVYITINKKDKALGFSSFKLGKKQKPRLGEYLKHLNSDAVYINLTGQNGTRHQPGSHAYFSGKIMKENESLFSFCNHVFNGRDVEEEMHLIYNPRNNSYKL